MKLEDSEAKQPASQRTGSPSKRGHCFSWAFLPCGLLFECCSSREKSSARHSIEDEMFYCSLCEVEVSKFSKHCRVCDKCVDNFDHHCRWLNNCIGKKNYRQFFTLMVSALLLLILQWCMGILVLIRCFLERKLFSVNIAVKLGSSFSLAPFAVVVAMCTVLAMIATLPLAQLFLFHLLLIKKGISTYDYIVALRDQEQDQQGIGGQQSQQMSPMSSLTGLSSTSSFAAFHRGGGAWCTPPRLFVEDQYDVVPPENASVSSFGKKTLQEETMKKKSSGAVRISPWALARLNAEEVSRMAAEARKRSKILQPVVRREAPLEPERPGSKSKQTVPMEPSTNISSRGFGQDLVGLHLNARSAFQTSRATYNPTGPIGSSPESSLDSPDIRPFHQPLPSVITAANRGIPIPLPRNSASDGYEASGGEDSDRVPSRFTERPMNRSSRLFSSSGQDERVVRLKGSSSSSQIISRKF
ncbi:probable protein S-acyltransferase 22 isoform X2 [Punica granatum]|nr:probable protein S-acyltransferase 22 isoform X2 [Punica granatum]